MPESITTMKNSTTKASPPNNVPSTGFTDEKSGAPPGFSSSILKLADKLQEKAPFVSKSKDKCTNLEEKITEEEKKDGSVKQHKIKMPQRKGGMQLWQFLYALLEDTEKQYSELIEWTHNRKELEFRLNDPEAIALWWGIIKHRANMTYERLSRSLRYYYDRGILKKMGGERYLYRFCIDPEDMYKHIGLSDSRPALKPMPMPVTKWVSNKMIPSHPLEPYYLASSDYMPLGMAHPTPLPPPPPYQYPTGYQLHSLQYQSSNQMGYDFFNEHESEQSFLYNGAHDGVPSFNSGSLANQNTSSLYSSNTTLAVASNSPVLSFTSQMQPVKERSFSTGELPSDSDSDCCSQQQSLSFPTNMPVFFSSTNRECEVFQYSPESSTQLQSDCRSPLDSGSGEEIELEDIIPLIESMQDSDGPLVGVSALPCTFTSVSNLGTSKDPYTTVVIPPIPSLSSCSQMHLQTSPSLCSSSYPSPSAWTGEDTWNFQ